MVQCEALTLKGVRCKKTAIAGTHFCSTHTPKSKPARKSVKKAHQPAKRVFDEPMPTRLSPKAAVIQRQNKVQKSVNNDIRISLILRATLVNDTNEVRELPLTKAPSKIKDKAKEIITDTLFFAKPYIKSITFVRYAGEISAIVDIEMPLSKLAKEMHVKPTPEAVENFFKDYYGDGAPDTWMEGDIHINENEELFLNFEGIGFKTIRK